MDLRQIGYDNVSYTDQWQALFCY